MHSFIEKHLKHYSQWDFLVFTLFTILSILNGKTTIFYILYFFWCNELLRIIIDRLLYKSNSNALLGFSEKTTILPSLFPMGIYFVFIVVFFGFVSSWKNEEITIMNMQILFFKNTFFVLNLIFVAIERILLHRTQQAVIVIFGIFTPNMLILHISIILGALLMFFVIRSFPEIFTPSNLWGSVIIIFPFLLIKAFFAYYRQNK
ncbi:hypothetical protein [Polaribacter sp. BM10]|uniref:hypothetical protein n=1 Tax=Polaribacter sp. BM10 TaxID=1529069 RepID=UPI0011EA54DE|nr:hypothetical protein [Polaribacter sp. BM10]